MRQYCVHIVCYPDLVSSREKQLCMSHRRHTRLGKENGLHLYKGPTSKDDLIKCLQLKHFISISTCSPSVVITICLFDFFWIYLGFFPIICVFKLEKQI